MIFNPRRGLRRAEALGDGETEGAGHANGDALAMNQTGAIVADEFFKRMTECMAEIEQSAVALFGLVTRDDGRLGFATHGYGVVKLRPAPEHGGPVIFKPGEEIRPVDQAIFDDFGIAGGEFARRQSGERVGVRQHQRRLMKGADQILAMAGIDARFAADRGIDLRQQSGGNLHEPHAAPQTGGGEASEVADHSAAKRDEEIAALHPRFQRRLAKLLEMSVILGRLAGRQHDVAVPYAEGVETGLQGREPAGADIGIGDDESRRAGRQLGQLFPGVADEIGADENVIGAGAEFHADARRGRGKSGSGHVGGKVSLFG
jgi:hypothetical protein